MAIHLTSPLLLNKLITRPSSLVIKTEFPLTIGSLEVLIGASHKNEPEIKSITTNFPDKDDVKKGKEFHFKLPTTHNSFVYLVDGEIIIGEKKHDTVKGSTLILLTKGEELKIKSKLNSKFLLISGKPINEEIARGGPFVMNTKSEILEAVNDYHNGTFVK